MMVVEEEQENGGRGKDMGIEKKSEKCYVRYRG